MSDALADEWITVAAKELRGFDDGTIAAACAKARRECNHHGKILPTVIAECEAIEASKALHSEHSQARLAPPETGTSEPVYPTLAELDSHLQWLNGSGETPQMLRRTGLKLGALIENENGRVRFAPGVWKYTEGSKTFTA